MIRFFSSSHFLCDESALGVDVSLFTAKREVGVDRTVFNL